MSNNDFKYMRYIGEHYFDNRFATEDEAKRDLDYFDFGNLNKNKISGGTPLISDGKKAWINGSDIHTLIIGSTGSMKSRAFIVPTILSLGLAGENIVASDPKGELFHNTSGFLKNLGYKVNVLNLRDFSCSHHWNPLHEAYQKYINGDVDTAKLLLTDIVNCLIPNVDTKDPFWPMAARDFLFATLTLEMYYAKDESEFNFAGLNGFLSRVYADDTNYEYRCFRDIVESIPDSFMTKVYLSESVTNAPNTRRGVLGYVSSCLSVFLKNRNLVELTAANDINLHDYSDGKTKVATFIIVPDEKTSMHFFCSLFIKQLYEILIQDASSSKGFNLPIRCNFLLDEFANIPAIPDMSSMISAARSRNIRFFLVLQSNAQLKKKYGFEEAENIKTNCQCWCFLNSKEMDMLKEIQQYIGNSSTDSSKPLLSTSEISMLEKRWPYIESIVMMSRSRPYLSTLCDMFLYDSCFKDNKPIYEPVKVVNEQIKVQYFDFKNRLYNPFKEDNEAFIRDLAAKEGVEIDDEFFDKYDFDEDEEDEYFDKIRKMTEETSKDNTEEEDVDIEEDAEELSDEELNEEYDKIIESLKEAGILDKKDDE